MAACRMLPKRMLPKQIVPVPVVIVLSIAAGFECIAAGFQCISSIVLVDTYRLVKGAMPLFQQQKQAFLCVVFLSLAAKLCYALSLARPQRIALLSSTKL